jgi:hypothetical protein
MQRVYRGSVQPQHIMVVIYRNSKRRCQNSDEMATARWCQLATTRRLRNLLYSIATRRGSNGSGLRTWIILTTSGQPQGSPAPTRAYPGCGKFESASPAHCSSTSQILLQDTLYWHVGAGCIADQGRERLEIGKSR